MRCPISSMVVVGAQWGDEGKGKIVDHLAESAEVVVRFGGGSNAGHTLVVGGKKLVLHLVPSGILNPSACCILGDGMVIDAELLLQEVDELRRGGIAISSGNLLVSLRAHLVLPYHRLLDELNERSTSALGTTRRGIGPAYEDKVARRGIRLADLLRPERLERRLTRALEEANLRLRLRGGEALELAPLRDRLLELGERLAPHAADTSAWLAGAMAQGKRVILEGAQGALLDIDHGTYPYVTSSTTLAGGATAGAGLGPATLGAVLGVAKVYTTRVGSGPFPSEMSESLAERVRQAGGEFGATTGRARRCGWLDLPALRYAVRVSGIGQLALTKLDVLADLQPLMVCEAYQLQGQRLLLPPADLEDLDLVEPELRAIEGFTGDLSRVRCFDELPAGASALVHLIEQETGVPVSMISVGPGREQTLIRRDPRPWA